MTASKTQPISRNVSWQEIETLVLRIVRSIQVSKTKITQIFGVPRGGSILSVLFSHHLQLPIIYDDRVVDKNTLIVDDAIESGRTFRDLLLSSQCYGAILYFSQKAQKDKTFSSYAKLWKGMPKLDNEWLTFPWEKH